MSGRLDSIRLDGADERPPMALELSAKEAKALASATGLHVLKIRQAKGYADLGKYLTNLGAKNAQRGMLLVNMDHIEKANRRIDLEIQKSVRGSGKDAEMAMGWMKLKLQCIGLMNDAANGMAVGAIRLKDEDGDQRPIGEVVPVLGDMAHIMPDMVKVTQTIMEVKAKDTNETLHQGADPEPGLSGRGQGQV